jgi:tetratricopeptide (TPR) repeat protein
MSVFQQKAFQLMQQSRFDLAEEQFRRHLAEEPDDYYVHAMLGLCLSNQEKYSAAVEAADTAIHLEPEAPIGHYALALALTNSNQLKKARLATREALRLDPEDSDFYSLLSLVHYKSDRWQDSLEAAEKGLSFDPGHQDCQNHRAMALVKLGRREEAHASIQEALRDKPENATTHANLGWTLLHSGDHQKALEHFREALRLEPEMEWARRGMLEALKARYWVYRIMLRFFFWISTLPGTVQFGLIAGIFVGGRLLRNVRESHPELDPVLIPLIILYFLFIYLTWISQPLFNLLLRLNKFGRFALNRTETIASNWIGGLLATALLSVIATFATGYFPVILIAPYCVIMTIPVSSVFNHIGQPGSAVRIGSCLALAALGAAAVATGFARNESLFETLLGLFLLGFFAYTIVFGALATIVKPRG